MPGLHWLGSSEPVEQNEPSGHVVHCSALPRPRVLLKVPSKHGKAAEAPGGQKDPGVQTVHAVPPLLFWYEPASHEGQKLCPVAGCAVPGVHSVGCWAPVAHDAPVAHVAHSTSARRPVALPKRPPGHGSGVELPSPQ